MKTLGKLTIREERGLPQLANSFYLDKRVSIAYKSLK